MTDSLPAVGIPTRSTDSLDRSYVRTNGRTNGDVFSPTGDNQTSVTRARTYGDGSLADCLHEAIDALEVSRNRLGGGRYEPRADIHPWTRRAIYWRDQNQCAWCRRGFDEAGMLVLDHIQPWADGGSDRSDNLRTLCVPCNEERSNYATDVYSRVTPVGYCDRCTQRPNAEYRWHQLDPESTFKARIFCGRCGCVNDCTDRRRVL